MERQSSTLKEIVMDRTSYRLAASVAAGLLAVGLTGAPAAALRLVPVDPPVAASVSEPAEDPALLMSLGRMSALGGTPTGTDTDPVSDTSDELFMSSGRLPR